MHDRTLEASRRLGGTDVTPRVGHHVPGGTDPIARNVDPAIQDRNATLEYR